MLIAFFALCTVDFARAIGVKEIDPTDEHLSLSFNKNDRGRYNNFMRYNCKEEERLNIELRAGEHFYFGFKFNHGGTETFIENVFIRSCWVRIKALDGTVVFGPVEIIQGQNGYIDNRLQAKAGPGQLVGANGYGALDFEPTADGTYYLEVAYNASNDGTTDQFDLLDDIIFAASEFDFTVADAGGNIKGGRVWSKAWHLISADDWNTKIYNKQYIYSDDGVVTELRHNGDAPFQYIIISNAVGVRNTGNLQEDRKSIEDFDGSGLIPQYKLFFDLPDTTIFEIADVDDLFGALLEPVHMEMNCPGDFHLYIRNSKELEITVTFDLNDVPGYQAGSADLRWNMPLQEGDHDIPWDGRDAFGNYASDVKVTVEIDFIAGLTHMPMYDVETNFDGFSVHAVYPEALSGPVGILWDDSDIGGTVNLDNPCQANCHVWGDHNVEPYIDFGDQRTINSWWYIRKPSEVFNFEFNPIYLFAEPNTTVCPGEEVQLIATEGMVSYSWTPSEDLSDSSIHNPVASVVNTTVFQVEAIDQDGCVLNDQVIVEVSPNPVAQIDPVVVTCIGDEEVLNATSSKSNSFFRWFGNTTGLSTNVGPNPVFIAMEEGTYFYQVEVTDRYNCKDTATVSFEVKPPPSAAIVPPPIICVGDSAVLQGSGGDSYRWEPSLLVSNDTAATTFAFPDTATRFTLHVYTQNGYCSDTASVLVVVDSTVAKASISADYIFTGDEVTLFADSRHYQIQWLNIYDQVFYDGDYLPSIKDIPDTSGTYKLIGITENGCTDTASVYVNVLFPIKVPNVFSPNQDGINDLFNVINLPAYPNPLIKIYNRWGNLVYSHLGPYKAPWKGYDRDNHLLPVGTYYFVIELNFKEMHLAGDITLLR